VEFAKEVANIDTFTAEAWTDTLNAVKGIVEVRMNELTAEQNSA